LNTEETTIPTEAVSEADAQAHANTPNVKGDTAPAESPELAAAREEARKNYDGWQRALADFNNYKRRVERERVEAFDNAIADVVKDLIPVIDDFERSLENVPQELQGNAWVEGTTAIRRKLSKLLERYEITQMDPVGEPFNPDRHQGLGIDENATVPSGHVSATLQKGYVKGDKLIRPALVKVAQ
jgi:molecular chaperone GrpE